MVNRSVIVRQCVSVTVDETKFDQEFMEYFSQHHYYFRNLDEHLEHLGELYARGIVDNHSFIEGYGQASDMGISFNEEWTESELEKE